MRLPLRSLQSRIALFHLLAIAIAAILVPLANYLLITQSTNQFEARTLRDHAASISQYLSQTSPRGKFPNRLGSTTHWSIARKTRRTKYLRMWHYWQMGNSLSSFMS
jgi:hypothetical protein